MEQELVQQAIHRIRDMEACFDMLQRTLEKTESKVLLEKLIAYYESGQWLYDYTLDEQGLLPKDLKRGVLAQDAVYDFLEKISDSIKKD